jgi:hypothetical protein
MKRTTSLFGAVLAAAAMLGIGVTAAPAQPSTPSFDLNELRSADALPAVAASHIAVGDELAGKGKYAQARREYRAAVDEIRAENGFPAVPLDRIAKSFYFECRYANAISYLDRLAQESAAVGDLTTHAIAAADAIWVLSVEYGVKGTAVMPGAVMEMKERLAKLRQLLASPFLPVEVRDYIVEKRCGGSCELANLTRL